MDATIKASVSKFQIEEQLVCRTTTDSLAGLIGEMCNNREMIDFILSFSDERIAKAMHKLDMLHKRLGIGTYFV